MVDKLLPDYVEGSAFHLFHSIESLATAGLWARTKRKPMKNHKYRIEDFRGAYSGILSQDVMKNFQELLKLIDMIAFERARDKREVRSQVLYYDSQAQIEPKDLFKDSDISRWKKDWNNIRDTLKTQITVFC
ncbi:MAG: hypothetical protein M1461_10305 [Nitrospirae bacterium]|nr:hypothetical protein [Nitrospirota bacterium]